MKRTFSFSAAEGRIFYLNASLNKGSVCVVVIRISDLTADFGT